VGLDTLDQAQTWELDDWTGILVCGVLPRNSGLCSRGNHNGVGEKLREYEHFHLPNDAMRLYPLSRCTGVYDLRCLAEKPAPVASRCAICVRFLFLAGHRHWDLMESLNLGLLLHHSSHLLAWVVRPPTTPWDPAR